MKVKVAILISGRGSNMAALLYASRLPDSPYEIVLVASNDPAAPGLTLAEAEDIPTFAHSHVGLKRAAFDEVIERQVKASGADYIALAGYMRLLSPGFVERWAGRIVNVHPSLLPNYKGLDTHQRAIESGDATGGCSVHVVTPELDDGPVLGRIEVAILPGDTPDSLAARVLIAEHQLYPRMLAEYVVRDRTPEAKLARLRAIAMALPGAEESVSHGMPCFRVAGGKMYCYFTQDHHGDGIVAMIAKTSGQDELAQLIDQDPDTYYRPAYFGAAGWVGMRLDRAETDWDRVAARVEASWTMIAPRKLLGMREF